jgi:hypothetical protein
MPDNTVYMEITRVLRVFARGGAWRGTTLNQAHTKSSLYRHIIGATVSQGAINAYYQLPNAIPRLV